ncbi:MAG: DUF4388 domain-containing protein [Pseudomonadota bacterium]
MEKLQSGRERRRGARIRAQFWTKIEGIETSLRLREGDISATGIYMKLDRPVGEPGVVHSIRIAGLDKSLAVDLMARVIRVLHYEDVDRGTIVAGAAFEFMIEDEQRKLEMGQIVRQIAVSPHIELDQPRLDYRVGVQIDGPAEEKFDATIYNFNSSEMHIETNWRVTVGEEIKGEIRTPSSKKMVRFGGQATKSICELDENGKPRYRVEVRLEKEDNAQRSDHEITSDESSADSWDGDPMAMLLEEALFPPPKREQPFSEKTHLSGALSRVRLPSLLAFFEMERMTGMLEISNEGNDAKIFFRDGQAVDVESVDGKKGEVALASLCDWQEGFFSFIVQPVDRKDRIGQKTSSLLLNLALKQDEISRQ